MGTIYEASEYNPNSGYYDYDDGGNDIISDIDQRGNKTLYEVDYLTSRCKSVTNRLGHKTKYEYNQDGRITKMAVESENEIEITGILYDYNSLGNLSRIIRFDGQTYLFNYNQFNRLKSIGTNTKNILTYDYAPGNGSVTKMTYANGDYVVFQYNNMGMVSTEIWYNKLNTIVAEYKYLYDILGNIVKSIDKTNKIEYNYIYENGKVIKMSEIDTLTNNEVFSIIYSYDNRGKRISKIIDYEDNKTLINNISSSKLKDQSVSISYDSNILTSNSKSDKLYRKTIDELQLGEGFVSRQYVYHYGKIEGRNSIVSSPTTDLVSQIVMSDGRTILYEYDEEEHIIKVTDSKGSTISYSYNELGELVKEIKDGIETEFTYDSCGNILSKGGKTYVYDENWKELLIQVGDKTIEYDTQGNPTTYLGNSLTWEKGKNLKTFGTNSYTYNANGVRIKKTVNGITHKYSIIGTTILREKWDNNTLIPLYDNEDMVCGIIYNSTPYYFLRNLHNDVIAITDKHGEVVAEYEYDAWGACTIKNDTTEIGISNINPFRYRSYYYDSETKLYYLNFRYYDPAIGRFISADNIEYSAIEGKATINLYSYCGNDPVNNVDTSGHFFDKIKNWGRQKIEQVKEVGRQIGNFVGDVAEDVKDFVEDAVDCAKETVEKVVDKAQDVAEKVTGTAKKTVEDISYIVDSAITFTKEKLPIIGVLSTLHKGIGRIFGTSIFSAITSLKDSKSPELFKECLKSLFSRRTNISFTVLIYSLGTDYGKMLNSAKDGLWEGVIHSHKELNELLEYHYKLNAKIIPISVSNENLKHNIEKSDGKAWKNFDIIYSQHSNNGIYSAAELKAGYASVENVGCELIAVYNACVLNGKHINFPSVIYWFEQNNGLVAGGNFGTNPHKFGDFFETVGLSYKKYEDLTNLKNEWDGEGIYVISSWIDKDNILEQLHTYAIKSESHELTAYNHKLYLPNQDGFETDKSFEKVIEEGAFVCGYKVWLKNQ